MVDRVKPWFIVYGLAHGLSYGLVNGLVYGTWFMVSLIMFFLNKVDYPFFPFKVHPDTIATLSGT